ncbi:MAG TPA: (4Fe-4S)-binding protein [Syntrophomonadaceae bacterium]|nr:(4Fe-4S)-binding protein [Syntrophomonadaceae bacterium]
MDPIKIKEGIHWVGVQDPELRVFDMIMRTEYGTSYNAYLIQGRDKTALVETVKEPFFDSYLKNIEQIVPLHSIDYLIMNHSEPDHAGSLAHLLELNPNLTVVAHPTALDFLKQVSNSNFKTLAVGNRGTLDLGGKNLRFIGAMFLHWPDTMYTYIDEDRLLFTCDSFGCHFSDERLFNDLIPGDFNPAYRYYFDHILSPFKPYVIKALDKLGHYEIDMICPGHGPILRSNVPYYINLYRQWSSPPPAQSVPRVVVAYMSAYGYTKMLAEQVEKGLQAAGNFEIKVFDLVVDPLDQVVQEIDRAQGLFIGSPTLNRDALPPIWDLLGHLSPITHADIVAAAFGSYGWSGEAVPNIQTRLHMLRMRVLPGLKVRFHPTDQDLSKAFALGLKMGRILLSPDHEMVEVQLEPRPIKARLDLKANDYIKRYESPDLTVYWNPGLCHHDTYCFTRRADVFNPEARPWVNLKGADPEKIIRAIDHCPSGALRYVIPQGSSLNPEAFNGPGLLKEE